MSSNERQQTLKLRPASDVQQDFAEASVIKSEIVWDLLGPYQKDLLKQKVDHMFGLESGEIKSSLITNIWKQRKYNNGALLHSIIYVLFTPNVDEGKAKLETNYTIHPVIRIRRCRNKKSSAGCCMIYVDEMSRIYQNWKDYIDSNALPYGIMIAPKNGCYSLNGQNKVDLECCFTPAYFYQPLTVIDHIVSATSFASNAATVFNPLFAVLTIGTKIYEAVRNYQKVSDEVTKGTTTSSDIYKTLACDAVSLTSNVCTLGAGIALNAGKELYQGTEVTLQVVNSAAVLIHFTTLIKTSADLFTKYFVDGEQLDFSDLKAFSSSLILFTNATNNFALISTIGKVDGNDFRSLLLSKIRSGLSFAVANATKYCGQYGKNGDILRLVNDIMLHKDLLGDVRTGFLTTSSTTKDAIDLEIEQGVRIRVKDEKITDLDMNELLNCYGSKFVNHVANCDNLIDILNCIGLYFSSAVVGFLFNQIRTFLETKVKNLQHSYFITTEMILYKMSNFIFTKYKNYCFEFLDTKKEEISLSVENYFKPLNPISNENEYECDVCGGYYYLVDL